MFSTMDCIINAKRIINCLLATTVFNDCGLAELVLPEICLFFFVTNLFICVCVPFINFCNSSNVYYKLLVPAQVDLVMAVFSSFNCK